MSLQEFIEKRLASLKTEEEKQKFLTESLHKAIWEVVNLLQKQSPPVEERNYQVISQSYTLLNIERPYNLAGNFFYYVRCYSTGQDDGYGEHPNLPIYVKLDRQNQVAIPVFPGQIIKTPFKRLFIQTQLVTTVTVIFIIGNNCDFTLSQLRETWIEATGKKRSALVDSSGHVQVDILSAPTINIAHNKTLQTAEIDHNTNGDNTIISATSGQKIYVYAISFNVAGTVNVTLKDGAATDLSGQFTFQEREGLAYAVTPPAYLFECSTNTAFIINLSAAINIDGVVSYWKE